MPAPAQLCELSPLPSRSTLQAVDRRERLRRLALETIDLSKDPYFMRNHLGQYECRLCLTLHTNEGNYLAHTQGGWRDVRGGFAGVQGTPYGQGPAANITAAAEYLVLIVLLAAGSLQASGTSRTWPSARRGMQQRSPWRQHRSGAWRSRRR